MSPGHDDRFERLVVRVELVINPAAAMRPENMRVAGQDGHAAAVSSDCRRLVVHTVLDPRMFLSHPTQGAAMRASMEGRNVGYTTYFRQNSDGSYSLLD
jgi:hypothetical protein